MPDRTTYQLEANEVLAVYENHRVKLVGNVHPQVKSIRVLKIEPSS
jgi:hypothetical protein